MKSYGRQKRRYITVRPGSIGKNLVFVILLCVSVKAVTALSENGSGPDWLARLGNAVSGSAVEAGSGERLDGLFRLLQPEYVGYTDDPNSDTGLETVSESVWRAETPPQQETETPQAETEAEPLPELPDTLPDLSSVDLSQYVQQSELDNNTGLTADLVRAVQEKPELGITGAGPQILIIHTHGSECYEPDEGDEYTESDPWRTEDCNYNMVHVGDVLASRLESRGIQVLHDRTLYDYPSYNGSYTRSLEAIEGYLAEYPDIRIVLDLHRDANESNYKTSREIGGVSTAQIMLIVGTDYAGLEHPNWNRNFQFAAHLQAAMNYMYPGLARELCLSKYRYNQQATDGSLIAEIGYNGNRLSEAENAAVYFADCLAAVLLS